MLNEMAELKELKSVPHRDFYNVRKVRFLSTDVTQYSLPMIYLSVHAVTSYILLRLSDMVFKEKKV